MKNRDSDNTAVNVVRIFIVTASALLSVLMILGATHSSLAAEGEPGIEARFTLQGELIRPAGWREWIFVGSPLTPNSLNNGSASFPEFHSVYIDPESWEHYKQSGEFREGTMLAKELSLVGATSATSGSGFFNGQLQGFEIAHKDSQRYPEETGGWAYYSFGHHAEPYAESAAAMPAAACAACHSASASEDMVFTQYYPILNLAKASGDVGAGLGGRD